MSFAGGSDDKESACNAGDPGLIPGLGRSTGEGIGYPLFLGFPCGSAGKESACNVRDLGSVPGLGISPGEGTGYPLQDSALGLKESDMTERISLQFKSAYALFSGYYIWD